MSMLLCRAIVLLLLATATSAQAQIAATIDTTQVADPITKYQYGMFIEHIGTLIYRGLWSEMLDDRKFYFPVLSTDPPPPVFSAGTAPRSGRESAKKWRPVGGDANVSMDKKNSFVGEQAPRIALDEREARGIRQAGLTLQKGKAYTGRIWLAGSAGTQTKISLVWGPKPSDRQTFDIPTVARTYAKYPLKFIAQADTSAGAFEITATGTGDLRIGTASLMPADNVNGFRADTISLLRQLNSGFWRLPGGNYISNYDWRDAVGDIDKRPPTFDYAWNFAQSNDVGMDELMTMCQLLNVEPYITVNAGFGDDHSAAAQVEYMNGAATTRQGALRARNGHPAPYHVKYWNIGNEPYGTWQLGRTDLKYYVIKHNLFAHAMRKVDPSITLLASGAMPDEMTIEGVVRSMHLDSLKVGDPDDWTGGLLGNSFGNFDGLTEHWYSRAGNHFDLDLARNDPHQNGIETGYVPVQETPLDFARHPADRVRVKAEEWDEYTHRFPDMVNKKIFLSVDEYSYSGAPVNLKLALAYSMVLNEMIRHTNFLKMSAFTMGLSTLDYTPTAAVLNTNGVLFKFYRDHLGTLPIGVNGNLPQPAPRYPVGGDQPAVTSGSPTYPLDLVATLTEDHKFLTVCVVNATETTQQLELNIKGIHLSANAKLFRLTGPTLAAANSVGKPPEVAVTEESVTSAKTLSVAPISTTIYQFPIR